MCKRSAGHAPRIAHGMFQRSPAGGGIFGVPGRRTQLVLLRASNRVVLTTGGASPSYSVFCARTFHQREKKKGSCKRNKIVLFFFIGIFGPWRFARQQSSSQCRSACFRTRPTAPRQALRLSPCIEERVSRRGDRLAHAMRSASTQSAPFSIMLCAIAMWPAVNACKQQ